MADGLQGREVHFLRCARLPALRCGTAWSSCHGYARGKTLLKKRPDALYVSEVLYRLSGGDLLADLDCDEAAATLPALVRVSRYDSVFARAMRRGGLHTVVAPIDVDAAAALLARMASGDEGTLRKLVHQSRKLHERTRTNRDGAAAIIAKTRQLVPPRRR